MSPKRNGSARLIDVAEKAGVSLATASFAMTGRPGVSEAVAERVRAIAAELGYVPNLQARSLASGASSTLGMVVHDVADPYFGELASAVIECARARGLMVQLCQSSRDPDQELAQVRALVASRVRAIIMAGSGSVRRATTPTYEELKRFQATGGRVALIGRHPTALDAVHPANVEGGRLVGAHIKDLGHRRVGVVAGPKAMATIADRLKGVREGVGPEVDLRVRHVAFTPDGGVEGATALLEAEPRLTALICLNDPMASGVLTAVGRLGLRVPDDMSVTGFDNVRMASNLGPGMTGANLPLGTMAERAVELALKEHSERSRKVKVDVDLVVRGSTSLPSSDRRDVPAIHPED